MITSSSAALQSLREDAETLELIEKSKYSDGSIFKILGFLFTGLFGVVVAVGSFGVKLAPLLILGLFLLGVAFWYFSEGYRFKKRVLKSYSSHWIELDAILIKDSSNCSQQLFSALKSHLEKKLQHTLNEDALYVFNKLLPDHQGTLGDLMRTSKALTA